MLYIAFREKVEKAPAVQASQGTGVSPAAVTIDVVSSSRWSTRRDAACKEQTSSAADEAPELVWAAQARALQRAESEANETTLSRARLWT